MKFPVPSIIPQQADDDDEDSGAAEDDSTPSKRSMVVKGRRSFVQRDGTPTSPLDKRVAPNAYLGPSQCTWGSPNLPFVTAKVNVKAPNYPAANLLGDYNSGGKVKGNTYLWVVTKPGAGDDSCDGIPWDYTTVSDAALKNTKNAAGVTYQYNAKGATSAALVNADHVYEIKILKNFIAEIAPDSSSDAAGCQDFLKFWIAEANGEYPSYANGNPFAGPETPMNRMQTLFKLLPGTSNPAWSDFVGMDKDVNGMKGMSLMVPLAHIYKTLTPDV